MYLLWLRWFLKIYNSQGSVATQLRCGGIFNNQFITNFLQNVLIKKNFENRSIFGEGVDKSMWLSFFGPPCSYVCMDIGQHSLTAALFIG